jgi:hypothetical protein
MSSQEKWAIRTELPWISNVRTITGSSLLPLRRMHGEALSEVSPVSCFDPRCVPERFSGPNILISAFRDAGGRATEDVFRPITGLHALVGIDGTAVIHNTSKGLNS